jgi:hypothetical protein
VSVNVVAVIEVSVPVAAEDTCVRTLFSRDSNTPSTHKNRNRCKGSLQGVVRYPLQPYP